MIYPDNPLLTLSDLADDEALNELELASGEIDYIAYIREDLRIAGGAGLPTCAWPPSL